ncbi:hypothetical protein M5K25_002510 [Dendrobium thyrsiflorum]|uniref:Reverse transcriptase zinc-binding domain-containing protein n=1 Tax=Dendrobium thyrsiflorum TaxID=117978 RepID=A0ABD0VV12_DENTH
MWHKYYALRCFGYTWMAVLNKPKTVDILAKRNIHIPSGCVLCNFGIETHSHLNVSSNIKYYYFLAICCSLYFLWRERNDRRFKVILNSGCLDGDLWLFVGWLVANAGCGYSIV